MEATHDWAINILLCLAPIVRIYVDLKCLSILNWFGNRRMVHEAEYRRKLQAWLALKVQHVHKCQMCLRGPRAGWKSSSSGPSSNSCLFFPFSLSSALQLLSIQLLSNPTLFYQVFICCCCWRTSSFSCAPPFSCLPAWLLDFFGFIVLVESAWLLILMFAKSKRFQDGKLTAWQNDNSPTIFCRV